MTVGIVVMLLHTMAFILFFLLSQQKLENEKQKARTLELIHREQLLYSNLQTQENERRRIAKDLHDAVGSRLNVIHLNLHRLQKLVPEATGVCETVHEIFDVIGTTIATTRRISYDLLPPTLENFGLREAIVEFCDYCCQTGATELQLEVKDHTTRGTDKMVELNLFRVLQELVSNSLKHGHASQICVYLWLMPTEIRLDYRDNGRGFDQCAETFKPGLGLQNIESRMRMIGADFTFESTLGSGAHATVKYTYPI